MKSAHYGDLVLEISTAIAMTACVFGLSYPPQHQHINIANVSADHRRRFPPMAKMPRVSQDLCGPRGAGIAWSLVAWCNQSAWVTRRGRRVFDFPGFQGRLPSRVNKLSGRNAWAKQIIE